MNILLPLLQPNQWENYGILYLISKHSSVGQLAKLIFGKGVRCHHRSKSLPIIFGDFPKAVIF